MNNERTATLLATLEACATAQVDELVRARGQVAALQEQNHRLEARNRELERYSHELERQSHELERQSHELEQQHHELALKHQELEAKCRELEEKFARAPHTADGHAHPRSQGLAALLAHRTRPVAHDASSSTPHTQSTSDRSTSSDDDPDAAAMTPPGQEPSAEEAAAQESVSPAAQESVSKAPTAKAPAAKETGSSAPASDVQASDGNAQASLPIGEAPSPQALLNQWYRRYPDAFFKGHTRPLRVGIHEDLLAREPWPEKLVRRALACYVHLPRYLKAVREHAERVGLDGEVEGPVTEGEARYARKKLEELRAQQQLERSGKATSPDGKPRADRKGADNKQDAHKQASSKNRKRAERQTGRQDGAGPGSARANDAASEHRSAGAHKAQPASSAVADPSSEAPAERLERKLGALLAKHSSR